MDSSFAALSVNEYKTLFLVLLISDHVLRVEKGGADDGKSWQKVSCCSSCHSVDWGNNAVS